MSPKALLPAFVVFALLASGCTGGPTKVGPSSSVPISTAATHTADTGGIEGRIIDDEAKPVAGAEVGLLKENVSSVRSSAAGKFAFSDLTPGKHSVAVRMVGFKDLVKAIDVAAGEITHVNLTLVTMPILANGGQNALSATNNTLWVHCVDFVSSCFMNGMEKDGRNKETLAGYNALGFAISGDEPGVAYFHMPMDPAVEQDAILDTGKTVDFTIFVGGCKEGVDSGYITVTTELKAGDKVIASGAAQTFNYQGSMLERTWSVAPTQAVMPAGEDWGWTINVSGVGSQICIGSGGQTASHLVLPVV